MTNINQKLKNLKITLGEGDTIKSVDLVGIINTFREVEGKKLLRHDNFMARIKEEIEALENVGVNAHLDFKDGSYLDKNNQSRKCYELSDDGMMMMLNKESTVTRYQTTQYIKQLKEQLKKAQEDNKELVESVNNLHLIAINEQDEIERVYKANVEKYKLRNAKSLLMVATYKNIDEVVDAIIEHHTSELKKCDRYEYYQNMKPKDYKQHVRSYLYDVLDEVRAERRNESILCEACSEIQKQLQKDYIKTDHFSQGKTDKVYEKKIQTLENKVDELVERCVDLKMENLDLKAQLNN